MLKLFILPLWLIFLTPKPEKVESPRLLWSDEFDYQGTPDQSRWTYDLGDGCPKICGWGNNELQYYTQDDKNIRVANGKLIIEARNEKQQGREYTSARLKSKDKSSWKYAYVEVRAKLPQGRGTWPAIWMLPDSLHYGNWPRSGEIDIMEHVGFDPGVIHGTVHTKAYNHGIGTQVGKQHKVESFNTDFHTYAINWTEDKIEFMIDNQLYHVFEKNGGGVDEWPFDQPFHIILNIAVGGGWGGQKGVDPKIWPQQMEVDYVRVYEPLYTDAQKFAIKKVGLKK